MTAYTGIRTRHHGLRINAFIEMGTQDAAAAVERTRQLLREQFEDVPAEIDTLEPWKVECIPASWGFPPRVMVTW